MVFNADISDFKQFVIDNNIIGTLAGVCVALAAKDGIQSFVGDIIIPSIVLLLHTLHIDIVKKYLPVNGNGNAQFRVTNFVKSMITFVLIILMTFVFVKFAFGYLLGIGVKKEEENKAAEAAKSKEKFSNLGY